MVLGYFLYDAIMAYRDWRREGKDASAPQVEELEKAVRARDREILFRDKELEVKAKIINDLKHTLSETNEKLQQVQESLDGLVKKESQE